MEEDVAIREFVPTPCRIESSWCGVELSDRDVLLHFYVLHLSL